MAATDFGDCRGQGAKECRQHLEDGKGKELDFPLEPSEERHPANTLNLA